MTVRINIEADSAEQARDEMRALLGEDHVTISGNNETSVSEAVAKVAADESVAASPAATKPDTGSRTPPEAKPKERPLPPTKKTREFAEENNVDLATAKVEGTGKNGRITKADVERFVELRDAGMAPSSLDDDAEPELPAGGEQPDAEEPEGEDEGGAETVKPTPSKPKDGDPTLEEARDKLMELSEHVSLAECREMCRKHGANKVQDIDPINFRAFMNDCDSRIRAAQKS